MKRILIAALVGAVVVFVWGAVAHMVLPLGTAGFSVLPAEREAAVLDALRAGVPEDGLYFIPALGHDMSKKPSPEEQKAWHEAMRRGPSGLLLVHPQGGELRMPRLLGLEFLGGLVAAVLAAFLLARLGGSLLNRGLWIGLIAVFAWLIILWSYWNWYGFPGAFVGAALVEEFVGWFLAGLAMAKILPTTRA